jgi:hypothetical protein
VAGAHLDDGALLRRLDGELDPAEQPPVESHLAACARCRAELEAIAAAAGRVSSALRMIDPTPRERGPQVDARVATPSLGAPIWRAAAAIALVAGLALAIAPVRAWISERLGLGPGRAATELHVSAETPASATGGGAGVRIAFVPTGDRFRILLATPQSEGELLLMAAPGDTASGEIVGADDADLLVLPDGLGIRNQPFATADYRVEVPRRIGAIEVEVAGGAEWRGSPQDLPDHGVRIALSEGLDRSTDR